jgi:hypothetical protein
MNELEPLNGMLHNMKHAKSLAACIRRAYQGPVYKCKYQGRHIGPEDPSNEYYWYTREACCVKARDLGIFFPEVIIIYEHSTNTMGEGKIRELSEEFWADVVHPELLVAEIMES